ncbi:hypothetical protein ERO13_D01G012700v2 [Gossypium hirsutum]|uniref:Uncharacterized protein n=1 Tax=Gossypium hirsutum TaxID=3635 RepID=A0A1U8LQR2_GOSHI|nr:uncharacterized protein LOC107928972 [Gossypium hirsutum]KAG4160679.1 hypothetical protein ERO13_D01G012700v2 [Gossypium hirsutum]
MALSAPSTLISHNRAVNCLAFSLPKLGNLAVNHQQLHSRVNFHSFSDPPYVHQCRNGGIFPPSCLAKTVVSDVGVHNSDFTTDAAADDTWSEFAKNVSGEWDGFGADFTIEGTPIELPESVVPEAYREWEVKVYDWQTQCPTLAEPVENTMTYKTIKLLPTVGCEADAATRYSIEEKNIGGVDNEVSAFAYHSSGCYTAIWSVADKNLLELEHCLINPRDRESRVRIIQVVRVDGTKFVLQNVRVFCEQWYGPFRNGDQLGGCAIRDSAFASTAATNASDVGGVWKGSNAAASFDSSGDNFLEELKANGVMKSIRDGSNLILLPKQLWCSLMDSGGETCIEVGWLYDQGYAITSRCCFSREGKLKEVSIARETTVLEGV